MGIGSCARCLIVGFFATSTDTRKDLSGLLVFAQCMPSCLYLRFQINHFPFNELTNWRELLVRRLAVLIFGRLRMNTVSAAL